MKKLIIGLCLLLFWGGFAQEGLALSIQQDYKLALKGDKSRGYKVPTTDILLRYKLMSVRTDTGYLTVFPEFEYADIEGSYYRYSFNVGYSFFILESKFEATPYAGFGFIDRYGKNFYSFGAGVGIGYPISDRFKIVSSLQFTDRRDLLWLWGTHKIGTSVFGGVEYKFLR